MIESSIALAVDAGQTGIKMRTVGSGPHERTLPGVQTNRELLPQLADAVLRAADEFGTGFEAVAVGASGLTRRDHDPDRLLDLCRAAGVTELRLAHDSVTSFLGALGVRPGVAVAAGTGVVVLGVGAARRSRVDGWGNIMGDAGSGYWIGRECLDAVMRAHDGRGPETALTQVVQKLYPDLEEAYILLQADPDRVRVVASFAKSVDALAATDRVAHDICQRAGYELGYSAVTAARTSGVADEPNPQICLVGNVFASTTVRAACLDTVHRGLPGSEVVEPQGDGLVGARRLLDLRADHPLFGQVGIGAAR